MRRSEEKHEVSHAAPATNRHVKGVCSIDSGFVELYLIFKACLELISPLVCRQQIAVAQAHSKQQTEMPDNFERKDSFRESVD